MPPSPPAAPPERKNRTVQVSAATHERLGVIAERAGVTRNQVVDHLVTSIGLAEAVRSIKRAGVSPAVPGRRKTSIFED